MAEGDNMYIFPQLSGAESVTNTSCLSLSYAGEHLIQEATHRVYAMRVCMESLKGLLDFFVGIKRNYNINYNNLPNVAIFIKLKKNISFGKMGCRSFPHPIWCLWGHTNAK